MNLKNEFQKYDIRNQLLEPTEIVRINPDAGTKIWSRKNLPETNQSS